MIMRLLASAGWLRQIVACSIAFFSILGPFPIRFTSGGYA